MPVKSSGRGSDPEVHRWAGGVTWIGHPDERMRRASHALADGEAVWVVEPVDADGLDDVLAELGTVAGVVVLADYHRRDAATVARRHDVPVHLPAPVGGLADDLDVPVERFDGRLPGTDYEVLPLLDGFPWTEAALHDPSSGTLVATEALVTSAGLTGADERLAVTPYVRLFPPRDALRGLAVERVLVGHGTPVRRDAAAALDAALSNARPGAPRVLARNLPYILRAVAVAMRD